MSTASDHRTKPVKVRGLLLNPPDGGAPRPVYVNDYDDWAAIHRQPHVRVACLVPGCPTRLIAKQMSRSGLRFFANKTKNSCDHNQTRLPLEPDDVEINPWAPGAAGGGPESAEHLWVKGRLFTIATKVLHQTAVVEESMTRADVYLPDAKIVLEYQRWATDFKKRSQQRRDAGAARTIWLVPDWSDQKSSFSQAVRYEGAMYLAVLSKNDYNQELRPWEHPEDNRLARLYVSGPVVRLDTEHHRLAYARFSLVRVLKEILSGERVFTEAPVYTKSTKKTTRKRVWVRTEDLARIRAARETQRPWLPSAATAEPELYRAPLPPASPTSPAAAIPEPGPLVQQDLAADTQPATPVPEPARPTEHSAPPPPADVTSSTPRQSLWSRIAAWVRRM